MIEPQSAQDGESALTEKATFVAPPKLNGIELLPPFPFAFPLPLACPFLLSDDRQSGRSRGRLARLAASARRVAVGARRRGRGGAAVRRPERVGVRPRSVVSPAERRAAEAREADDRRLGHDLRLPRDDAERVALVLRQEA